LPVLYRLAQELLVALPNFRAYNATDVVRGQHRTPKAWISQWQMSQVTLRGPDVPTIFLYFFVYSLHFLDCSSGRAIRDMIEGLVAVIWKSSKTNIKQFELILFRSVAVAAGYAFCVRRMC
jgi:hypothetical protein